jgi:hypothetical protein
MGFRRRARQVPQVATRRPFVVPPRAQSMSGIGPCDWDDRCDTKAQGKYLGTDFSSSKTSRPAMWINQEVIRKLALNWFKSSILCSKGWAEFENSPSSNHWLNWAASRYDDSLLKFAIGARLYPLNTPARNRKNNPNLTSDIPCQLCGKAINPDLFHILSN